MAMFRRAYKRIQLGPVSEAFVNWKLNQHANVMMQAGSHAMSKTLAGIVRESGVMMFRRTLLHWTQRAMRIMVHSWRASACEMRHGQQVMYLAEENDGLTYQLQEQASRLSELERFSAFFDQHTSDFASPKSSA